MRKSLVLVFLVILVGVVAIGSSPLWKPAAKRSSKWVVVATNIYQDVLRRSGMRSDQIGQDDGEQKSRDEMRMALVSINNTFNNYTRYLPGGSWFSGKHVLEIGPGDNAGVALRFIGAGAERVVAIDKFVPLRTGQYHQSLYRSLRDQRPTAEQGAMDEAVDLTNGVQLRPERLAWVSGVGIEERPSSVPANGFDLIVSNAVLEEVYDIDRALDGMDRVLRPGGFQIHKVDLRDYGMFTKYGYHPLEFLTIRDGLYRFMVESTGQPNRRLVNYYRDKAAALGYSSHTYITWVLGDTAERIPPRAELCPCGGMEKGRALIREIRPRLIARYKALPDEDLMVQGILFVAQKPGGGPAVVALSNP